MTIALRPRRTIALLILTLALTACSAIKLAYNNLDTVAYWWLNSYVDFSDEQAWRAREEISKLHLWHRTEELPQIAEILHGMEETTPGDITETQVCAFVAQIRQRLNQLAQQAEPAIATLAMSLTPDQLLHLERKYAKNNARFRAEWIDSSADKRFGQFVERSEMIYGKLEEPQLAALRRQMDQSLFDARRLLAERERRQQDALQTLRKIAGTPVSIGEAQSLLHDYLARVLESPDPAYRRYQQALIEESCKSYAVLHNSTTATQRATATKRLRAYQRDLHELSSR